MPAIVSSVVKGSIAEELEIQAGDEVVSIDDSKMLDMIDYNFLCKSDLLTIEIKKINISLLLLLNIDLYFCPPITKHKKKAIC